MYEGFLYAGLMIVNNEPYLIEYNVRMGDLVSNYSSRPETDLIEILLACCEEKLSEINIKWSEKSVS